MRNLLLISVALAVVGFSIVSAETGSTNTGTTSTGTTITGVEAPLCDSCGAGGPARAFNVTTKQFEMVPQCFPWVWLLEYYKGNISDMYHNQEACRVQRKIDFGM